MRLLLARHGETTWNLEGRYQGRKEAPLSARGNAQANAMARRLASEDVHSIVSSPLSRTTDTAKICADALGLHVAVDERLLEISHGTWEGRTRDEIAREDGALLRRWQQHPDTVTFPGGESLADVQKRLDDFIAEAERRYAGVLLVVTHDVIVRLMVLAAQGRPRAGFNEVQVDNAALSRFELGNGRLTLTQLNEVDYLGDLRSPLATQAR
ncbi:MAG: histidine phosphatase family protein [Candidatus Eremiobacteraeota bacterium]|nr:histidine phosphatase family protein [Candidatus Eremiobacteraeota bacterium]